MLEERTDQCGAPADLGELHGHALCQMLALLQGSAGVAGALGVTPDQFVGVEVGGIAGQAMQRQFAVEPGDVLLDRVGLVRRQSIQDQMQGFAASAQHPAQQIDEEHGGQCARIGGKPEGALGTDRRGGADALALSGDRHHRRLSLGAPGLALNPIGTESGFVPEVDLGLVPLGCSCNRRVRLALPALDRHRVALVGALQRLLRRQALAHQQRPNRRQAQAHIESLGDQFAHDLTCPQTKIEPVLHRGLAVDPTKHLPFLRRGQGPWATGRRARRQRLESLAPPARHLELAVDRAAVKTVAGDHLARALALTHTLDRHLADGFQSPVIQRAAVSLHGGIDHLTNAECCLYC